MKAPAGPRIRTSTIQPAARGAASSLLGLRYDHTATLLSDGKVLLVGGLNSGDYPGFSELSW